MKNRVRCLLPLFAAAAANLAAAAPPASCTWSDEATQRPVEQRAKLLVRDAARGDLLVDWKHLWEVPGQSVEPGLSPFRFVTRMAADYGLRVRRIRHVGTFEQFFAGRDRSVVFHWFTAEYAGGETKLPPDCPDCLDVRWFAPGKAAEATPYPVAQILLRHFQADPDAFWSGSYEVDYRENPPGGRYAIRRPFSVIHTAVDCSGD